MESKFFTDPIRVFSFESSLSENLFLSLSIILSIQTSGQLAARAGRQAARQSADCCEGTLRKGLADFWSVWPEERELLRELALAILISWSIVAPPASAIGLRNSAGPNLFSPHTRAPIALTFG